MLMAGLNIASVTHVHCKRMLRQLSLLSYNITTVAVYDDARVYSI